MTNTLVLMRHGKSAYPKGVNDFDRPLAPRGIKQATESGLWISQHVGAFDLILCSPAKRTKQTLQAAHLLGPVVFLDALYDDSHLSYFHILKTIGGQAQKVAIVGHHPAITKTALKVTKNTDSQAARKIADKFVTSGVALFDSTSPWPELKKSSMFLEAFFTPPRP